MCSTLTIEMNVGKQSEKIERNTRIKGFVEILFWIYQLSVVRIARSVQAAQSL